MKKILLITSLAFWFASSAFSQEQCGEHECGDCETPELTPVTDSNGVIIDYKWTCRLLDPCCLNICLCICCNPPCNGGPEVRGPIDPNDLIPPAAVGDKGWIRRDDNPLPFRILFENLPAATLPAQRVVVTAPLGANVDYASFHLTSVTVPGLFSKSDKQILI